MGLGLDQITHIIEKEEVPLRNRKFSSDAIQAVLRYGACVGSVIEQHEQLSRGADYARKLIQKSEENNQPFQSGTVVIADEMLQSKGRFNRYWHAPKGGIWLTLAMVNTLLPESNLLLPMATGVACCEVLRHYGVDAHIKWVNDTHIDNGKISGILTETFTGAVSGEEYVLAGIGINVNNNDFPPNISGQATSLKACLGKALDLQEFSARLIVKLRWNIGLLFYEEARLLEKHGGIANINTSLLENLSETEHLLLESYRNLTDTLDRRVLFGFDVQQDPQFEAKVVGLDRTGGLILELEDTSRVVQHSGEIIYLD
jgi:BirA family biotin operon repressor/biotin-[acetyl-CoA-carboxylase] ligase